MFIKIIHDSTPNDDAVYECTNYSFSDMSDKKHKNRLHLRMESTKNTWEYVFEQGAKIYIMNDLGKTIDTIIINFPYIEVLK